MNKIGILFFALSTMGIATLSAQLPIVHKLLPGLKKDLPD